MRECMHVNFLFRVFEFCSTHVSTRNVHITRYKELWSTQTHNRVGLEFSRGTTHVHMCKIEVIIERYRIRSVYAVLLHSLDIFTCT